MELLYLLAALAGQRYAHITAMRSDQVNPKLLGMKQVMSEDSIRRAFQNCDSPACQAWQQKHLRLTYEPLLTEPYLIDIDTTVKPLHGKQEGAEIGPVAPPMSTTPISLPTCVWSWTAKFKPATGKPPSIPSRVYGD